MRTRSRLIRARIPSAKPFMWTLIVVSLSACSHHRARGTVDVSADQTTGSGNRHVSVMVEPRDGVRPLLHAVDRARDRVFVEDYILTDRRIVRALERAATAGVAVNVLLERHPLGMGLQPERVADQLQAAHVSVRWTRSNVRLTHAKYMVIDDRLALISTANLSRSGFGRNREFIVVDRERLDVGQISSLFRADWNRTTFHPQDANLLVSPGNARSKLYALIRSARTEIAVYAEEIADLGMERLLVEQARRGRVVRLILPVNATPLGVATIARGGVQVRSLVYPYPHAKAVIVDDREAFLGSVNMSAASLDDNRELGILVSGKALRAVRSVFRTDWRRAVPVDMPSTR